MTFRRRKHRDFAQEIEAHLALEAERLRAEGLPAEEARRRARRNFGNVGAAQERFYDRRRVLLLDTLIRDARYAVRALGRSPGFAAAAILTLALGIGANTAIFSAIDEILFRPPDVPQPERLVQVYSFNRKTAKHVSSSYPDYVDFQQQARSLENLSAYVRFALTVQLPRAAPERISVEAVSGNYFETLHVAPLAGRTITPADDAPAAAPVAMISEELWRTRLGADPGAIGAAMAVAGRRFLIVGVAPKTVRGFNLNWVTPPRIWIPLHASASVIPRFDKVIESRAAIWLVLLGRLKAGVTTAAAQADLQRIAANIDGGRDLTALVYPLSRSKFWPSYRSDIETSLSGFAVASGLILLLACANVSNLLLGRAMGRRREIAMRLAIGAGRGRIVRQLVTESAILAALSCGAALAAARGLMLLLRQFPNALGLPLHLELAIDPRALTFCIALSVVAIALFGFAPAMQTARLAILPSLKEQGNAGAGGNREWLRAALVGLQAAFAMILLVGGGLYGRTLLKAYATDLGFRSNHLLTAWFSLPPAGAEAAGAMASAQQALLQKLAATTGVVSATISSSGMFSPAYPRGLIQAPGSTLTFSATYERVGDDFFKTLGIPVLEGSDSNLPEGSVLVNRTLAKSLWRDEGAVGRTILWQKPGGTKARLLIAGVVGDARYGSVWESPVPTLYLRAAPADLSAGFLSVRTSAPPAELSGRVRKFWNSLMPLAPLYEIETADERVSEALQPQRVAAGILGGFGILAVILTVVGLYSVVAYSVAQQKREIGIRIAIGARPNAIFRAVLRRSMLPALAGVAAGSLASLPLMRVLGAKANAVSPYDPATYAAVAVALVLVALAAAVAPARRAMGVDPAIALRSE